VHVQGGQPSGDREAGARPNPCPSYAPRVRYRSSVTANHSEPKPLLEGSVLTRGMTARPSPRSAGHPLNRQPSQTTTKISTRRRSSRIRYTMSPWPGGPNDRLAWDCPA
jgi:hypothetical protein